MSIQGDSNIVSPEMSLWANWTEGVSDTLKLLNKYYLIFCDVITVVLTLTSKTIMVDDNKPFKQYLLLSTYYFPGTLLENSKSLTWSSLQPGIEW